MTDAETRPKMGERVRYRDADWANRAVMTVLWVSLIDASLCLVKWPDGSEHTAWIADLEQVREGAA